MPLGMNQQMSSYQMNNMMSNNQYIGNLSSNMTIGQNPGQGSMMTGNQGLNTLASTSEQNRYKGVVNPQISGKGVGNVQNIANYPVYSTPPPVNQGGDSQSTISSTGQNDKELEKIVQHILNLRNPDKREEALTELSKRRESFDDLAPLLWHSVGTIAILLQEIVSIYQCLSPPNLSSALSSRVCSVLGLLQCLALHTETRGYFLKAHIPLYL